MGYEGLMTELDFADLGIGFIKGGGVYGTNGVRFGYMRDIVPVEECFGFVKGGGTYGSNGVRIGYMKDNLPVEDLFEFMGVHRPWDGGTIVDNGNCRQLTLSGKDPLPGDTVVELTYDVFVADFTFSQVAPGSLLVQFTDQSSENPTYWEWSFGDTNHSLNQDPYHLYSIAREYIVNLFARNKNGNADSISKAVNLVLGGDKASIDSSVIVIHSGKKAFVLGGVNANGDTIEKCVISFLSNPVHEDTL